MKTRIIKIYPPVYMLMGAALIWAAHQYFPVYTLLLPPWNQIGLGVIGFALSMDLYALLLFFKAKTTPHPFREHKTCQLVITGIYRLTRNPMYVGLLLLLTGWTLYLGTISGFMVLPLFIWVINHEQIVHEEQIMLAKFGACYRDYQQRVRRWLW